MILGGHVLHVSYQLIVFWSKLTYPSTKKGSCRQSGVFVTPPFFTHTNPTLIQHAVVD